MKPSVRTRLPGPNAVRLKKVFDRLAVTSTFEYPLAIKDGKGCFLQDVDGNWFLDFNANVASCPLGYRHPRVMEVLREYSRIGAHKIAGQDFYTEEHARLLEALRRIMPGKLKRAFLVNSGAEAVENAMKFAWRKLGPLEGVSCTGAFHGRTIGALSHTHSKAVHKRNYPELPHHIIRFCSSDSDQNIGMINEVIAESGKPAFVIVEPIQGENGYIPASKKFLRALRAAADENGFPLIFDEVQCGMGRTGRWWAFENYDVLPDMVACAKALQVGAAITTDEYAPTELSAVSTTWGGGHRIDMAVALAHIEGIEREKLLSNSARMGARITKRLAEMQARYPMITDVRGMGLMIGIEFQSKAIRDIVLQECLKRGLLLLGCGRKAARVAPPLVISGEEVDMGLDILEDVLAWLLACKSIPKGWAMRICPRGMVL